MSDLVSYLLCVCGYIVSTAHLHVYTHCLKTECFSIQTYPLAHPPTPVSSPKERFTNVLVSAEEFASGVVSFCQG